LRIAVTGTKGQVAQALQERGRDRGVEVVALGRPDLDLMAPATVAPALRAANAEVVVNAAAYTAVDKAESEPEVVDAVNARGAGAVAAAASALGLPLVHLSTDYVFAGDLDRPYREDDPTGPTGAYGRSKLAGEAAVAAATPDHAILRTAWVYSPFGANFVKSMLRLAATRDTIGVVADQHGSPTSALDIADAVLQVCTNLRARPEDATLRDFSHGRRGLHDVGAVCRSGVRGLGGAAGTRGPGRADPDLGLPDGGEAPGQLAARFREAAFAPSSRFAGLARVNR